VRRANPMRSIQLKRQIKLREKLRARNPKLETSRKILKKFLGEDHVARNCAHETSWRRSRRVKRQGKFSKKFLEKLASPNPCVRRSEFGRKPMRVCVSRDASYPEAFAVSTREPNKWIVVSVSSLVVCFRIVACCVFVAAVLFAVLSTKQQSTQSEPSCVSSIRQQSTRKERAQ